MSRFLILAVSIALLAGAPQAAPPAGRAPDLVARGPADPHQRSAAAPAVVASSAAPPGSTEPGDDPQPIGRFSWPLAGVPAVVRPFETPAHRFAAGHRGVDLASAAGAPVLAAGAGTVVFAGAVAGRTVVSIDHAGGLRTTYEPVSPLVRAGDVVTRGQQIGTVQPGHGQPGDADGAALPGDAGCGGTVCLHWGVRRGMDYLDPLRLLGLGRVRLLPWEDAEQEDAGQEDAGQEDTAGG